MDKRKITRFSCLIDNMHLMDLLMYLMDLHLMDKRIGITIGMTNISILQNYSLLA